MPGTIKGVMAAAFITIGCAALVVENAAADPVFPTMNDAGGVYWRSAPDWNTPVPQDGNGHYPGTTVSVRCAQSGSAVPGSANTMWVMASWVSGPGHGSGWINEHFLSDGAPINQAAGGVPACDASTPTPAPTPAPAPSAGCYGDYCSGKDPTATGCGNDAVTVAVKTVTNMRLELRWSPRCKTNWARLQRYTGALYVGEALELRGQDRPGQAPPPPNTPRAAYGRPRQHPLLPRPSSSTCLAGPHR